MPHWLIKSAIHRAISVLPGSQKWNELFQKHVTKSLGLSPGAFEAGLNTCRSCLDDFLEIRPQRGENFTVLELGTGWYPIMPIGLYLCGATEVWTFDIEPLLRRERLKVLLNYFCEYDRTGALQKLLPRLRRERLAILRDAVQNVDKETPESVLARLGIHVEVRDAQKTGLAAGSVDFLFSYSVLEYIPSPILANILAEFKRLARPGAVMIHYIDLFDQFSVFDKTITQLNFLKYSSARWKWLRSPLIPANRMRASEYRSLIKQAGFEMVRENNTSAPVDKLDQIRVSPEFETFSREDLRVVTAWMVSTI